MNIGVIGCGYVGLSLASLLAQKDEISLWDIDSNKISLIRKWIVPFKDSLLEEKFLKKELSFRFFETKEEFYNNTNLFFVAVPTDYDEKLGGFNTLHIENIIEEIVKNAIDRHIIVIIKSTIPIGYVEKLRKKYNLINIFYMPEFLREGHAYYDMLHPSRIIVGGEKDRLESVIKLLNASIEKNNNHNFIMYMEPTEAEAVKLFSNAYLAMRVSFFNEMDTFAEKHGLNVEKLIEGISKDNRIGNYYNNPSFGYGGYCLPKDTKQLLADFNGEDDIMISAIVKSNIARKNHIVDNIIAKGYNRIGIYRLIMKSNSDNFRQSAMYDIMNILLEMDKEVILYEPLIPSNEHGFSKIKIVDNVNELNELSEIILVNRMTSELDLYKNKVYSRDVHRRD